jgi:hypothetical protein
MFFNRKSAENTIEEQAGKYKVISGIQTQELILFQEYRYFAHRWIVKAAASRPVLKQTGSANSSYCWLLNPARIASS